MPTYFIIWIPNVPALSIRICTIMIRKYLMSTKRNVSRINLLCYGLISVQ
jgi:hypothetical protein